MGPSSVPLYHLECFITLKTLKYVYLQDKTFFSYSYVTITVINNKIPSYISIRDINY